MDINELVLTDEALNVIDSGTWVGDLDGAPGVEFLVCGIGSKDAQKALTQKQAALRLKNRGKPLNEEQLSKAMRETLAEVVLKGWRGLKDGGKDLPYTPELATKFITSRNGERFAGMVLLAAQRVDADANLYVEELAKN
ncbi:hypothetical protein GCM10010096_25520 [Alcaligenes pakistanensis]|uniref:Uncharacterized protein n=1 Tax=Alcaligenes pakistanensis TaxID=1482717 RepID=A0A8H9M9A1_9BURK|nr:hypothetical protein [Alcaligenes pakistanensis]GHC52344.1 hypothetical protein GCM10010096_25520 [Alcaligenes pakistanensis]